MCACLMFTSMYSIIIIYVCMFDVHEHVQYNNYIIIMYVCMFDVHKHVQYNNYVCVHV